MAFGEPQSTIPFCPCATCRLIMSRVAQALEGLGDEGRAGFVTVRVAFSGYKPGPAWTEHGTLGEDRGPIAHVGEAE
jgi:hypothetical protein